MPANKHKGLTSHMQMDFHTTMRNYTFTTILAAFLCSLITPITSWAEVNTVPLSSITSNSSLQSKGIQISPASLAAMMKQMRYKKEKLFGDIFSSEESKIDGIFSSGKSIEVFSDAGAQALSIEIAAAASTLGTQQVIAFKSEMGRVKGYVFFSGQQSIWYLASIEGRPAHKTKIVEDESYMLDDPEADSRWNNKVEKSFWLLKPQRGQSLYQDRPDWLRVPIKHIAAAQTEKIAQPQRATSPAPVRKATAPIAEEAPVAVVAPIRAVPGTPEEARSMRIEKLQKLLSMKVISASEYDAKIISIIEDYNRSHPDTVDRLVFLQLLWEKGQISPIIFKPRRQELLEKL